MQKYHGFKRCKGQADVKYGQEKNNDNCRLGNGIVRKTKIIIIYLFNI